MQVRRVHGGLAVAIAGIALSSLSAGDAVAEPSIASHRALYEVELLSSTLPGVEAGGGLAGMAVIEECGGLTLAMAMEFSFQFSTGVEIVQFSEAIVHEASEGDSLSFETIQTINDQVIDARVGSGERTEIGLRVDYEVPEGESEIIPAEAIGHAAFLDRLVEHATAGHVEPLTAMVFAPTLGGLVEISYTLLEEIPAQGDDPLKSVHGWRFAYLISTLPGNTWSPLEVEGEGVYLSNGVTLSQTQIASGMTIRLNLAQVTPAAPGPC